MQPAGSFLGAVISIATYITLAVKSRQFLTKIPLKKLRLISGILLTITATPLIVYSAGLPGPDWLHWIIPPLE